MSQTGWLQDDDLKTEATLVGQGATRANMPNDSKIFLAAFPAAAKLLSEALAQHLLDAAPFLMHANPAGADTNLYVEPGFAPTLEGMAKFLLTGSLLNAWGPGTINFSTQITTATVGNWSITWPVASPGSYYRLALVYLPSTNTMNAVFSGASVNIAGLTNAQVLFSSVSGGIGCGWVDLLALSATTFKTANSTGVNPIIENQTGGVTNVYVAVGGGASSGGGGSSGGLFSGTFSAAATVTMSSAQNSKLVELNSSGGAFNMTLPPKSANYFFGVKDVGQSLSTDPVSLLQNVDGAPIEFLNAPYPFNANGGSWLFYCDGTQWLLVG